MISFDQVTKAYNHTKAINNVSFVINEGEFVFILGPSGAGKTTIRKLLIKELESTSGEISVGDYKLSSMKKGEIPALRQQIGVIFQDYKLLPDRTTAENIALALEINNKSNSVIKKTIPKLLELVGLQGKAKLFPSQLSGGEAQRVVIARALASDPAVLFADEPTGNLDYENSKQIVSLLEKINNHGTTVIMATHDNTIVEEKDARKIILKDGQLTKDTDPPKSSAPVPNSDDNNDTKDNKAKTSETTNKEEQQEGDES